MRILRRICGRLQDYLDAEAIAERYGVRLSDDEDSLSEPEPQPSDASAEAPAARQSAQPVDVLAVDLAARTQQLILKLDEKNREIERLCTLLEAVQPVEGLDPSKIYDILDGTNDMPDYKDAKIVDLAKRLRRMTVQLNKERAKNVQANQRIAELEAQQQDAAPAAAARAASPSHTQHNQQGSTGSTGAVDADPAAVISEQKREIAALHKQVLRNACVLGEAVCLCACMVACMHACMHAFRSAVCDWTATRIARFEPSLPYAPCSVESFADSAANRGHTAPLCRQRGARRHPLCARPY